MGITIDLTEYQEFLRLKDMQYDKYKMNGDKVRLDDNSILSVLKAIDPDTYLKYVERIIKEYEIEEK